MHLRPRHWYAHDHERRHLSLLFTFELNQILRSYTVVAFRRISPKIMFKDPQTKVKGTVTIANECFGKLLMVALVQVLRPLLSVDVLL